MKRRAFFQTILAAFGLVKLAPPTSHLWGDAWAADGSIPPVTHGVLFGHGAIINSVWARSSYAELVPMEVPPGLVLVNGVEQTRYPIAVKPGDGICVKASVAPAVCDVSVNWQELPCSE